MNSNISWTKFELLSRNIQEDFEGLSRLIFKYKYLREPNAILTKKYNNPGIETEPYLVDGIRVGFQAKYFIGNIGYEQILDSVEKIVANYSGKIDKVIFFCNKDINDKTKNFKRVIEKLTSINATYELCCNDSMLDLLKTNEDYGTIRSLFFGVDNISKEWFKTNLIKSLNELSPRYDKTGVHIGTKEEMYIHSLYRDSFVFDELKKIKETSIEELRTLYSVDNEIKNEIFKIIQNIHIPQKEGLEEVLEWFTKFESVRKKLDGNIEDLSNQIESIKDSKNSEKNELSNLNYKRHECYKLCSIIDNFKMDDNPYTKYVKENVLIVEGEAGTGKSHLLGYVADVNQNNPSTQTILLLGHKFIFEETPAEQIVKMLGINTDFTSFMQALEAKGELDGTDYVIMIDAINECDKYDIWKCYLNDLVDVVERKKHIKLLLSIRSTYKNEIFNDYIKNKLENNEIPCIKTSGFRHNLDEAIPVFFEFYRIPLSSSNFFNYELENPLFLKVYCETYNQLSFESNNLYSMFSEYMIGHEKNIKKNNKIDEDIIYSKEIVKRVGKYFFENRTYKISYFDIIKICNDLPDSKIVLDGFIRAKIFIKIHSDDQLFLYMNYQRFADYSVALYLFQNYSNYDELNKFLSEEFNIIKSNKINAYNAFGYITALSVIQSEYFDSNFSKICNLLENSIFLNTFIDEYLNAFLLRANCDINKNNYVTYILPVLNKYNIAKHFELLVSLSLRDCELNSLYLCNYLDKLSLNVRDYLWTIFINDGYEPGNIIYNLVNFAFKHNLSKFKTSDLQNYILLLGQFLSSTDRELRDKASKAITLILISKNELFIPTLDAFLHSNDPYIVSRIMGCCYGAVINIEIENSNIRMFEDIANYIFNNVFNVDLVYEDILFRDYSFNIIDSLRRRGIILNFEFDKCKPPYNTKSIIPDILEQTLIDLYNPTIEKSGLRTIKFSMMPELSIEGFGSGYGDFGRYTFDSALSYFSGFDKKKVFKFAFFYLMNNLKYNEKLFSEYDFYVGYGRDRHYSKKERIGKKYEWITMYHILSIVSDLYPLSNRYTDKPNPRYLGAWYPYVRDYDPSLFLQSMERVYDLKLGFYWDEYENWNFENKKQWSDNNDITNFKNFIFVKDSNGDEWISLYFSKTDKKEVVLNKDYESIWMSSTAMIIKSDEKKTFLEKVKHKNFWGRWFEPAEVGQEYTVFLKEYVNSMAFDDSFARDDFIEGSVACGKETVLKTVPNIVVQENGNIVIDGEKEEMLEEIKYLTTEKLSPCYLNYLWEEEYDYSKNDNINLYLPSKFIIIKLGLKQKEPGLWYMNDDLVVVDFQLVKNSNVSGIYAKRIVFEVLKKIGFDFIWIGMGEKTVGGGFDFKNWLRNDLSSLVWIDNDKIEEINHSDEQD